MKKIKFIKTEKYFTELNRIVLLAGSYKILAKSVGVKRSAVGNWAAKSNRYKPSVKNCSIMGKLYGANRELLRGNK